MEKYINIDRLVQAKQVFERFRVDMVDDRDQAGAVQAFEFCYELAWKLMQRILKFKGVNVSTPRDTFREAALAKIIDDPEIWFEFQKKRNLTSHTYRQENLDAIVSIFDQFSTELEKVLQGVKAILEE